MLSEFYVVLLALLSAFIAAVAQYLYKLSMPEFSFKPREILSVFLRKNVLIGLFLYFVVALPVYLIALSSGALSFVYPIFASAFIFVLLISHFMLHEKIGMMRIMGVLLIFVGIVIISLTF